jgi:hypothetical protein
MALQRSIRIFIIQDGDHRTVEQDPLPGGSVLECKKILSGRYPRITNSTMIGPKQGKNGEVEYELSTVAAEKG